MRLIWLFLALATLAVGQKSQDSAPAAPSPNASNKETGATVEEGQLPPDEDKASKVEKQYSFNPLQSKKEVSVGEFYFKKGDFNAAASRFREATKWNDGNADAWLRLGDAEEKMKDSASAREAWQKYLQLAPQAKNAAEVKKKLERLRT
jgi:tetratricopeptide (TPR) repeat protein